MSDLRWILYPGGSWHIIRRFGDVIHGTYCGRWIPGKAEEQAGEGRTCEACFRNEGRKR